MIAGRRRPVRYRWGRGCAWSPGAPRRGDSPGCWPSGRDRQQESSRSRDKSRAPEERSAAWPAPFAFAMGAGQTSGLPELRSSGGCLEDLVLALLEVGLGDDPAVTQVGQIGELVGGAGLV